MKPMCDPYDVLGGQLRAAAYRHERHKRSTPVAPGAWLRRVGKAPMIAMALIVTGGGVALATSGMLNGTPVSPEGPQRANAGDGLPAKGGSRMLALRTADPAGGLPWGMRIVHTTRGEICVQIGRVKNNTLGELGIGGAFHNDGRFHPLPARVLPNYSRFAETISCIAAGQTFTAYDPSRRSSGAPASLDANKRNRSRAGFRAISFGVLGPDAVSVTIRTGNGLHTRPVSRDVGSYLVVGRSPGSPNPNGPTSVLAGRPGKTGPHPQPLGAVTAITYRFGSLTCSVGSGAPVSTTCPQSTQHLSRNWINPRRSLNENVRVRLIAQSRRTCMQESLGQPCYRAQLVLKAPYPVRGAGTEYDVLASGSCRGGRPHAWIIDSDVKAGAQLRTESPGSFTCAADSFVARYINRYGPHPAARHESVIVGVASAGTSRRAKAVTRRSLLCIPTVKFHQAGPSRPKRHSCR